MYTIKHHVYTKARGDLWVAHRTDRDRTTARIELGLRVHRAIAAQNPISERIKKALIVRTQDKETTCN